MVLCKWYIKAKLPSGLTLKGLFWAARKKDLYLFCQHKGIILLKAQLVEKGYKLKYFFTLPSSARALMYEQLALALEGGFTLPQALERCATTPLMGLILSNINFLLEQGYPLAELIKTMDIIFKDPAPLVIKAGLQAGKVGESFRHLASFHQEEIAFVHKMKKGLHYPALVLTLIMVVLLILNFFLVPQLETFLAAPGQQQSPFLTSFYVLPSILLLLAGLGFAMWLGSLDSRALGQSIRKVIARLSVIGPLLRAREWWVILHTYEILILNHYYPLQALEYIEQYAKPGQIKQDIAHVLSVLEKGKSFDEAILSFATLQSSIKNLLALGAKTGNFKTPLRSCCKLITHEVDYYSHRLITILEPLALIIMGGMMLILILTVFGPLYDQLTQLGAV